MEKLYTGLKKIRRFFRSRKLALVLIILIIIVSFLGTIIPQQHIFTHTHFEEMREQSVFLDYMDMIGFTSIYTSWLFFAIIFLFFLNTAFCTLDMCSSAMKKYRRKNYFKQREFIAGQQNNAGIVFHGTEDAALNRIVPLLKVRRYQVKHNGSSIYAVKNRFGLFAVPLFHLTILLVLLAILFGGVGRMEGRMNLVEGQMLAEQHQDYFYVAEGPLFHEKHRNFSMYLNKFDPAYVDTAGIHRGPASEIIIFKDGKTVLKDVVHSNRLIDYDGATLFQNEYGFSPLFLLKNEIGQVISGSYVNTEYEGGGSYQAAFPVSDTGLTAQITLYPNTSRHILESGHDIPDNPQVFLELYEGSERVFEGVLGMNQMVVLGSQENVSGNITLGFYDLKYWSIISVVIDRGVPFIFAGFGLAVLSLSALFFLSPRYIWAAFETGQAGSTMIFIGGRSDKYTSAFNEELNDIIKRLKEV